AIELQPDAMPGVPSGRDEAQGGAATGNGGRADGLGIDPLDPVPHGVIGKARGGVWKIAQAARPGGAGGERRSVLGRSICGRTAGLSPALRARPAPIRMLEDQERDPEREGDDKKSSQRARYSADKPSHPRSCPMVRYGFYGLRT